MPNYLKMPKKQQVLALLDLGWSYRRIEAETGVRRETVARYDASVRQMRPKRSPALRRPHRRTAEETRPTTANPAKTFAGSAPNPAKTFPGSVPRGAIHRGVYRDAITEKLDAGLSLQRMWQDLAEEYGYSASYESVKRYVRTLAPRGGRSASFTAPPAPKRRSTSSAARPRSTRRPASGGGPGCFA